MCVAAVFIPSSLAIELQAAGKDVCKHVPSLGNVWPESAFGQALVFPISAVVYSVYSLIAYCMSRAWPVEPVILAQGVQTHIRNVPGLVSVKVPDLGSNPWSALAHSH